VSSLLTGKKTGNFVDSAVFCEIRLEKLREFSTLRNEFPTQQNRELIRDNRETIPPYQAGTGKSGNWRPRPYDPARDRRRQAATASARGALELITDYGDALLNPLLVHEIK